MTTPADAAVTTALRLGWAVAEARGRVWPEGPRPAPATELPVVPLALLPLRSQRPPGASLLDAASTLGVLAERLRVTEASTLRHDLVAAVRDGEEWSLFAERIRGADAWIQDELAQRDDQLANAYLLGRGLAECYWGLGREPASWGTVDEPSGMSPTFLFDDDRVLELRRMLGRLKSGEVSPLSASVIDGSLVTWQAVSRSPRWLEAGDLQARLYEQVRVWYQLLVLGQDPTTLIEPSARLNSWRSLGRTVRAYALQLGLAVAALAATALALVLTDSGRVASALATGGFGAVLLAGGLARGQDLAQQLAVRLRQDAYTDLVALNVVKAPRRPEGERLPSPETLVRRRQLTPPTPPTPAG